MKKKQIDIPRLRLYNLTNVSILVSLLFVVLYFFIIYLIYGNLPAEVRVKALISVSAIYFSAEYISYTRFAVLNFYEGHFEILCPLRLFWRKASYNYQDVSELHLQDVRYPSIVIYFQSSLKRRRDAWSIYADFRGGDQTLRQLTDFLNTKDIKVHRTM